MESYHLVLAVRYPPQNDAPLTPPPPPHQPPRPWVKINTSVPRIGLLGVKTKHFLHKCLSIKFQHKAIFNTCLIKVLLVNLNIKIHFKLQTQHTHTYQM